MPIFIFFFASLCFIVNTFAVEVPIYDFPIDAYSQKVNDYISNKSPNYQQSVLSSEYQYALQKNFYRHYFSSDSQGLSPWSALYVKQILNGVSAYEEALLNQFDNRKQNDANKHYGANFKEHNQFWIEKIRSKIDFDSLQSAIYNPAQRAIAINNTMARALPESEPDFYHFSIAGQGFPFDNLQDSAIWLGTPLYVISVSNDKTWSLVLGPDMYFSWVKSSDIAFASEQFIKNWQHKAKKNLAAIRRNEVSISNRKGNYLFSGYIGAVYPLATSQSYTQIIYIPFKNANNEAQIQKAYILQSDAISTMPLSATPEHIASLLRQLQNRPYGWGGQFFFNDCSQELKSLFTPLGIWLPRNSASQAKMGTPINLSSKSLAERMQFLKTYGHPLMSIVYIGGHVLLYVGRSQFAEDKEAIITYQNVWGLSPQNNDKRYIIGQSLFLPLLEHYQEAPEVESEANRSQFTIVNLDELPVSSSINSTMNLLP